MGHGLDLLVELDACLLELAALGLVVRLHARQPALGRLLRGAQLGDDVVQTLILAPHLAHLVRHQHQQRPQPRILSQLLLLACRRLSLQRRGSLVAGRGGL
jgi:hypothetical protein